MFETIANFFKKLKKSEKQDNIDSKTTAKERLHLVLMQDRANVSADFLELMKQEIIEVIKKYIDVQEEAIDVRLTNKVKDDGSAGAPFLYANIPIVNIKNDIKKQDDNKEKTPTKETKKEEVEKPEEKVKTEDKTEENKIEEEKEEQAQKKEEQAEEIIEESKVEEIIKEELIEEENTKEEKDKEDKN